MRQLVATRSRPLRLLKAFEKVTIAPGERKIVTLKIRASDLGFHDDLGRYLIEPGPFEIYAGGDSTANLTAKFDISAK